MAEDSDYRPPSSLRIKLNRARRDVEYRLDRAALSLDPDAERARAILESVGTALARSIKGTNLPKVLQVKTEPAGREFVSVRRLTGQQLLRLYDGLDPEHKGQVLFSIDPGALDDGQIAALFLPEYPRLTNDAKAVAIHDGASDIEIEAAPDWILMRYHHPELYDPKDWEANGMRLHVLGRRNGKFYAFDDVFPEYGLGFRRVNPNRTGRLLMAFDYISSDAEVEIIRDMSVRYSSFYILTEGSSQPEQRTDPSTRLTLQQSVVHT